MALTAIKQILYPPKSQPKLRTFMEYVRIIISALVIAGLIRTFYASPYKIPSGSMVPTLFIGDYLFVSKYPYGSHIPFTDIIFNEKQPNRGDIIVFKAKIGDTPKTNYIKRVIGLPGDTIAFKNEQLIINGKPIIQEIKDLEYVYQEYNRDFEGITLTENLFGIDYTVLDQPQVVPDLPEMIIPHDKYVVMGDNRDSSFDSRLWFYPRWGFIDRQEIVGRAEFIFWSWNENFKPRFDRMFESLRYSQEKTK